MIDYRSINVGDVNSSLAAMVAKIGVISLIFCMDKCVDPPKIKKFYTKQRISRFNKVVESGFYERDSKTKGFISVDGKLFSLTFGNEEKPIAILDVDVDRSGNVYGAGFVYDPDHQNIGVIIKIENTDNESVVRYLVVKDADDLIRINYNKDDHTISAAGNYTFDNGSTGIINVTFIADKLGDISIFERTLTQSGRVVK